MTNYPFEQMPADHVGWDRKHFDYCGRQWSLLVINTLKSDCTGELRSQLSDRSVRRDTRGYWKSHHHLSVPCRLTVDAAICIIDDVMAAYEEGKHDGADASRSEIRKVLGL